MTMTESSGGRFDIGRVISRTSELIGRNIVPFGILSLVFTGAPYFVMLLVLPALASATPDASMLGVGFFVLIAVYLISSMVLQAALTRSSVDDLSGKTVSVGSAISTGVAVLLPMLGLALVYIGVILVAALVIGVVAGALAMSGSMAPVMIISVLFLVAAIYLILRWIVAAPVLVVERTGVFAAIRRSVALTQNHRWAILGLLVLYAIFVIVLQLVVTAIIPGAEAAAGGMPTEGVPIFAIVVLVLMQVVTSLIITVAIASIYFELRQLKDGVGVTELAQVFA